MTRIIGKVCSKLFKDVQSSKMQIRDAWRLCRIDRTAIYNSISQIILKS